MKDDIANYLIGYEAIDDSIPSMTRCPGSVEYNVYALRDTWVFLCGRTIELNLKQLYEPTNCLSLIKPYELEDIKFITEMKILSQNDLTVHIKPRRFMTKIHRGQIVATLCFIKKEDTIFPY